MIKTHRSRSISTLFHSIFFKNSSENHGQADSGALEHFRLTPGRQNSKNHQKSLFLYHSRSISTRFYSIFFLNSSENHGQADSGALQHFRLTPGRQNSKNHRKSLFLYRSRSISTRFYSIFF